MKNTKTEKTAFIGILGALALALSACESYILPALPFLPPGAKPGLSNIVTMYAASCVSVPVTVYVVLIKSVFALITRGATAFFMSLAGGVLSALTMIIMLKKPFKNVSYVGIGVVGAVMHNTGQLIVSLIMTGTGAILGYAPFLMLFGVITGFITGSILKVTIPAIEKTVKK